MHTTHEQPSMAQHGAIKALRRRVFSYYRRHRRALPWRLARDPYRILVSEVMLQQTQVDRVVPKYHAFLRRFPTLRSLAAAPAGEVLRQWVGLGYNSRAMRLWRCAQIVVARHRGRLPADEPSLRRLPGIGAYTAAAVASFAFGRRTPAVDINVQRVLARSLAGQHSLAAAAALRWAHIALPVRSTGAWTQSLMDIGAQFCRARPRCGECPLRRSCSFFAREGPHPPAAIARPAVKRGGAFIGSTRYYRGRIVRALTGARALSRAALGRKVKPGFSVSDRPWLDEILRALQRDGLLVISPRGGRVSLP